MTDPRDEHRLRTDWKTRHAEELALIRRHFTMVSAGYQMFPGYSWPGPDSYRLEGALAFVEWARANEVAVTFHGLGYVQRGWPGDDKLWAGETVKGVRFEGATREERERWFRGVYGRYLDTFLKTFAGKVHSWDVANEHVRYGKYTGRPMVFNDFPYLKAWGVTKGEVPPWSAFYLETFRRARELDPTAKLVYLDYSNEIICDKANTHYAAARALLERGCPMDAIGFQLHQGLGLNRVVDKDPANAGGPVAKGTEFHTIDSDARFFDSIRENVARIGDLGLEVWTMETDVTAGETLDVARRRERQAFLYRKFVEVCLEFPHFTVFKLWGTADFKTASKFQKADAYLFDSELRPKPAFFAVADALATYHPETWWEESFNEDAAGARWELREGAQLKSPGRSGARALALAGASANAERRLDLEGSYAAHLAYRWQWAGRASENTRVVLEVATSDGQWRVLKSHDFAEAKLRSVEKGWLAGYCTLEGCDGRKDVRLRFRLERVGETGEDAPTFLLDDVRLVADRAER